MNQVCEKDVIFLFVSKVKYLSYIIKFTNSVEAMIVWLCSFYIKYAKCKKASLALNFPQSSRMTEIMQRHVICYSFCSSCFELGLNFKGLYCEVKLHQHNICGTNFVCIGLNS